MITRNDFDEDPHARRYGPTVDAYPAAFSKLLSTLNDPRNTGALEAMERVGKPALAAIVGELERDTDIRPVLESGPAGHRFRQLVGVAVRLRMEELGWSTTGRKGSMAGVAEFFSRAERYAQEPQRR